MSVDDLEIRQLPRVGCSDYILSLFKNSSLLDLKGAQDYYNYIGGASVTVQPIYIGASVGVFASWILLLILRIYLDDKYREMTFDGNKVLRITDIVLQAGVILTLLAIPYTLYTSYLNMLYVDLKLRTAVFALRELELDPGQINITYSTNSPLVFEGDHSEIDNIAYISTVYYGFMLAAIIVGLALWLGITDIQREAFAR